MSFVQKFEDLINTYSVPCDDGLDYVIQQYADKQLLFLPQHEYSNNSGVVEVFTNKNSQFFRRITIDPIKFEYDAKFICYNDYDSYLNAFKEMCWNENFADNFPEYGKLCDEYGCDIVDLQHLTYFFDNGLDAQKGLEKLIQVALDGHRYVTEGFGLKHMIQMFLDRGATLPTNMIFSMPPSMKFFEDDIQDFNVKSYIIDFFPDYLNLEYVNELIDWENIEATYWEDMDVDELTEDSYFIYLKYMSMVLSYFPIREYVEQDNFRDGVCAECYTYPCQCEKDMGLYDEDDENSVNIKCSKCDAYFCGVMESHTVKCKHCNTVQEICL